MVQHWRSSVFLILALCLLLAYKSTAQAAATDTLHTASGLRYLIKTLGTGPTPQPGDKLTVDYTGFLPNGKVFDSSATDGRPLRLRVGHGEVIKGWDEVLLLLPAGTRARVWIPAALAYGAQGARDPDDDSRYTIPPNTDLVFELTVVKVK